MSISIPPTWKVDRRGNVAVLALTGDWLAAKSGMLGVAETDQIIGQIGSCTSLQFDTALLARWDSALVAFVWRLHDITGGRTNLSLDLSSLPEPLRRLVCLAAADKGTPGKPPRAPGLLKFAHAYALGCCAGLVASADLLGTFALSIVPALRGRLQARTTDLTALMQECGSQALGIITVVNGLVGAILAFVGAVQLQRFGAGIYVADLVGVATVRESQYSHWRSCHLATAICLPSAIVPSRRYCQANRYSNRPQPARPVDVALRRVGSDTDPVRAMPRAGRQYWSTRRGDRSSRPAR